MICGRCGSQLVTVTNWVQKSCEPSDESELVGVYTENGRLCRGISILSGFLHSLLHGWLWRLVSMFNQSPQKFRTIGIFWILPHLQNFGLLWISDYWCFDYKILTVLRLSSKTSRNLYGLSNWMTLCSWSYCTIQTEVYHWSRLSCKLNTTTCISNLLYLNCKLVYLKSISLYS